MNSLTLRAVAGELEGLRGKVTRVVSTGEREYRIDLDREGALVLGLHPQHNTLYPVAGASGSGTVPDDPLARTLDRALAGSRFRSIEPIGLDRMIAISFVGRDRLGDPIHTRVILELTGGRANLLLAEGGEGIVRASLRDLRSAGSRIRIGRRYEPPASGKAVAGRDSREALVRALGDGEAPVTDPRVLVEAWAGLGPRLAAELLARTDPESTPGRLAGAWIDLVEGTRPPGKGSGPGDLYAPNRAAFPDGKSEVLCFRSVLATSAETFPETGLALAAAHREFLARQGDRDTSALARAVRRAAARTDRALAALDEEAGKAEEAGAFRRIGEALLAAAHTVPRGAKSADIPDPRSGGKLTVRLNPKLGAAANAELYFKRARKAERRQARAGPRRRELEERREALARLGRRLETGPPPDADWIREARSRGVNLPRTEVEGAPGLGPEERLPSALRPRRYDLGEGWELLVGRSNRGNEVLTHEIARPEDIWMHADLAAGSHAVLRHDERGREPPPAVLQAAAGITAWFSKARNSAKTSVMVSRKKHVRRARKAAVGTVLVGEHRTLMVEPTEPGREKG